MKLFADEPTAPEDPPQPAEPRLMTRSSSSNGEPKAREAPRKPRRRILAFRLAGWLLLTVVLLAVATTFWLRHAMRDALPQLDGTAQAPGLSAPVTVARDEHGVPSLQASTLDDLLFAQGFVTAQDRLWQMDALRRHAAGELAEVLGGKLVAHDRMQRYLQLRAAADRAVPALPPDQLHQLEAYARGVNAFIAQNGDHLPIEFRILRYKPAPWTPRDSLLVALAMTQDLSTEFPTKLSRETLAQHLAPELMADLYPVGSWRDHPPGESTPDLTSPRPEIDQIPLDDSQSRLQLPGVAPAELLAARAFLLQQTCEGCRSGSNNWAVAGSRSASGMPLLSNDMHLALGVPAVWYEASLHVTGGALDVTGLTLPGTPFVIVGRNEHVAWGFTNLGGDVQDLTIEHLRGSGNSAEFQRPDGTWAAVQHHSERIRVRGGSDVVLDVQTVTHSIGTTQIAAPILSPLYPSERRALSLTWTAYDPGNVSSPFLGVNTADSGTALVAALASFGGPTLNLVYADDHNHIGYHAVGRIPVRGPAVHHPVAVQPERPPDDIGPAPANEDDSALTHGTSPRTHTDSSFDATPPRPMLMTTAFRPRRRVSPATTKQQTAPHAKQPAAPKPEEAPIAPLHTPSGYTIGSPIPAVPIDAFNPNAPWSGYIPYAEMPAVTDPATGILATANARITPDDYPYAIALNWASPYRVERINHVLSGRTDLTPADMLRLEMDVHSEFDLALAHRIAYALDQTALQPTKPPGDVKRLHQAADILRNWNGDVDAGAAAPSIVASTRRELMAMLLPAQIAAHDHAFQTAPGTSPEEVAKLYSWGEQGYALEQLVLHAPARWLPLGVTNWNELLTSAVAHGLVSAHAPGDLALWGYGKEHPVEFAHPLLSSTPIFAWVLGIRTGSGPLITGGDTSTVKATSHSFGPTERFTADLRDPQATTSNITTGQSGNPASQWYLDQLPFWLGGTTLPMPLHSSPATHTLTLKP